MQRAVSKHAGREPRATATGSRPGVRLRPAFRRRPAASELPGGRTYTRSAGAEAPRVAADHQLADGDGDSSSSQLQALVDGASRLMGRPVAIDDRHLRVLVYTEHAEDELDRYRLMSIMKRSYPPEAVAWLEQHDLWSSAGPVRIPANRELEYDARVAAPIRCQGHHFGWVWCTDRERQLSDADLERLGAIADEAAFVLYREMLLRDLNRSRERELLRDMVSEDASIRREAAWRLAEHELFTPSGRVVVLVVPLGDAGDERSPESDRIAVEAALMRIRRQLAPRHGLHLLRPSHALFLASLADPRIRVEGVAAFAGRIREELAGALAGGDERRQIVAVGGVARELTSAYTSYSQALRACDVARTVSTFADVVCWGELGIYQLLTEIPIGDFGPTALHAGLGRLLDDPRASDLLPTLERYLELAGDVHQTAASLYVHRTTLYHRLRRIEQIAGVDLRNGDDRLALHLSLKIARLQGAAWPVSEPEPGS